MLLLVHSFWRLKGGAITHELTLENYRRLFGTELYPDTILFSAGIALRVTLFSLLLAYPLAYLLAFKVKRHKQLMYMAVIIPLWVSYLVRAYAWKIILGQEGILNGLLQSAGLIDQPLTFLLYSRWAVILALTHIYTPFTLMPIYAVLEAIPVTLKEASQDLYANRWQTFLRVILPLSLPGVLAGSTFAFVLSMGDFLAPQLLGGNDSALMVSNLVWSLFGVAYNWPLGAAVSVVVLLLTLFLLWLANRVETAMNYSGQRGRSAWRSVPVRGWTRPEYDRARIGRLRPTSDRLTASWLVGGRRLRLHLSAARRRDRLLLPRFADHRLAAQLGTLRWLAHWRTTGGCSTPRLPASSWRCWPWSSRCWWACPAPSCSTGSIFLGRPHSAASCCCRSSFPGIITGVALLTFFSFVGLRLSSGFPLVPGWPVVLGHAAALTSVVITQVFARLQRLDRSQEEASQDLYANELANIPLRHLPQYPNRRPRRGSPGVHTEPGRNRRHLLPDRATEYAAAPHLGVAEARHHTRGQRGLDDHLPRFGRGHRGVGPVPSRGADSVIQRCISIRSHRSANGQDTTPQPVVIVYEIGLLSGLPLAGDRGAGQGVGGKG